MKIFNLKLEKSKLINLIIFLIGFIAILIGILISINDPELIDLPIVLISVGSSIIASSIIAFISLIYISTQTKIKEIIEKWGLIGIYNTRAEMNIVSNYALTKVKDEIDLVVMGMREFRDAKGKFISEKVQRGTKIRILTMHPNSVFVEQREIEEGRIPGEIKKTIEDLIVWVEDLKLIAPSSDNVSIKFYDTCPQDSYMRIDHKIFIGPNHYKKISQQTISYVFGSNLLGFLYYSEYFEKLWNDKNFAKPSN